MEMVVRENPLMAFSYTLKCRFGLLGLGAEIIELLRMAGFVRRKITCTRQRRLRKFWLWSWDHMKYPDQCVRNMDHSSPSLTARLKASSRTPRLSGCRRKSRSTKVGRHLSRVTRPISFFDVEAKDLGYIQGWKQVFRAADHRNVRNLIYYYREDISHDHVDSY